MNYCIIDDEPIAHRIIEGYCGHLPYLKKRGNCYDAFEALQFLNENVVDLIFLDINMPKLSGFELLKTLKHHPKVIVTSAYQEFALEGYELNISDYLLKPFSFERFLQAVNKAKLQLVKTSKIPNSNIETSTQKDDFISIKAQSKLIKVMHEDILFIEGLKEYVRIVTANEQLITLMSLKELIKTLPSKKFLRCHKSYIIYSTKVKSIEGNLFNLQDHIIPVSRESKTDIINRIFG